ncbi:hypothetical protein IEO21_00779 [Rhodonia placenta]|uniref:DUF1682-domain-containing protein n=2 Tax=Rhodonia placenta TaxID=104341 RepID=A0A1X6MVG2_9APHY|nr:hypothetical protein POSPLADRAFT_1182687 [Postia placenta MAD-698-R-SB12]KAF9821171.1 hypothetical protein IEO21_00779 [Postia placenta]OSX60222.1 hypothetical protein POSPLADRAFT_1182687 [Postia placenta MAD-698-R-SB12]
MASLLLSALTPPPVNTSPDYDGVEYRWKMFTFRPAFFQYEPFLLVGVLLYVAFHFWGKKANETRVNTWYEAHRPLLEAQFSKPTDRGLIRDGNSDWFNYSTGRRALTSLHTIFTVRPRHDFFQYAFQIGKGLVELDYRVYDEVELDFTFKDSSGKESTVPDCVWAVVAKDEIKSIRKRRWDLTFTKTTDQPGLPPSLTVMSEFADITANLLKPLGPLNLPAVLSDPTILPYFRCLSLTDQPRTRPSIPVPPADRRRHLTLTLALPPASEAGATLPLLVAAFQLVDAIAGTGKAGLRGGLNGQLRPETRVKLRKIREEVDKEIREDAVKEKREEQAEEKAAAKRKAEEERLSRLSAADQKKAMDREKKRAMRKSQGRVKVR